MCPRLIKADPVHARIVCLLPARNCAKDLPGWFRSVEEIADAVVALDDGSTDNTRELLEAHPLVQVLLANPTRESYAGWDDAANRNRLLRAAGSLRPDWLLSLDADERLPLDDAAELRAFVEGDALPGIAYGFRVYRMVGGGTHYDPRPIWVYRLFAHERGQVFPERRLHFNPVPCSIPHRHWLKTTIRIQHLGSSTPERRSARYMKYRESDPDNEFQRSYRNLLTTPRVQRPWKSRPSAQPVLLDQAVSADPNAPVLSAIVISRDDEERIEPSVLSVTEQECDDPFEVIVVTSGSSDRTAEFVRRRFPGVVLVALPHPALPGEARNAGLRIARGRYISFPGSHVVLPPGSLAARIRAHEKGYSMVTGSLHNGTPTSAGWASYFLDHSASLPGRPSHVLKGPPAHCSYTRASLLEIGGFREDMRAGEDTVANRELARRGHRAYRASDIPLVHCSPCTSFRKLLTHHFVRGRWWGRILRADAANRSGGIRGRRPGVRRRVRTISQNVDRWGEELKAQYRAVLPLVVAGSIAAWVGAWFELLRPGAGKHAATEVVGDFHGHSPFVPFARAAARHHHLPEMLFLALIKRESSWRPRAVSRAGAVGLGQLMPATAHQLAVDPWDPEQNLEGAARYLRAQYDRFGSWPLALAAYNAGPDQVERFGDIPPFPETRRYVDVILARAGILRKEGVSREAERRRLRTE